MTTKLILSAALLACAQCITFSQTFDFDFASYQLPGSGTVRSISSMADLNEDGRIDIRVIGEISYPSGGQSRILVNAASGTRLVGNTSLTVPRRFIHGQTWEPSTASPGLVVDPNASEATPPPLTTRKNWFRISDNLDDDETPTNWGATNSDFYLGLVASHTDGRHAGWVHLSKGQANQWAIIESAWEPIPGAPLAVGSAPSPMPPGDTTFNTEYRTAPRRNYTPDRDITLGLRHWTNHADHSHGLIADVRGNDDWRWLVEAGGAGNMLLAKPLRTPLPLAAGSGEDWATNGAGFMLYSEAIAADGTTRRTGSFAGTTPGCALFAAAGYQGWVQLDTTNWQLSTAVVSFAAGGPEAPFGAGNTTSVSNLDLDDDGLVDFELLDESHYDAFQQFSSDYHYLAPMPGASIYRDDGSPASGTPHFIPLSNSVFLGESSSWDASRILYTGSWHDSPGYLGVAGEFPTNGFAGLRWPGADGVHFGWIALPGYALSPAPGLLAYNYWPGGGIGAGVAAPSPLLIQLDTQGTPIVRWPAALPVVLERFNPGSSGPWTPAPVQSPGAYSDPATSAAALFRLRWTH